MLKTNLSVQPISEDLKSSISKISGALKPIINEIHKAPATTQNYYGDYLSILTQFQNNKAKLKLVALSMLHAGANPKGIESAVNLLAP
jgi:hypothetical protein